MFSCFRRLCSLLFGWAKKYLNGKFLSAFEDGRRTRAELWAEVLARSAHRKSEPATERKTYEERGEKSVAKPAVAALREGDVRKALRILHAAPLAAKNEATFTELILQVVLLLPQQEKAEGTKERDHWRVVRADRKEKDSALKHCWRRAGR